MFSPNVRSIHMSCCPFSYNSEVDYCDTKDILLCRSSSCCLKKAYIWVLQHIITFSCIHLFQNLFHLWDVP